MGTTNDMGVQCSWGNKPTPPGTSSVPLPPPHPAAVPTYAGELQLAYERQLALTQMAAAAPAMLHAQSQLAAYKQAAAASVDGAGISQALYDGGFPNPTSAQQLYY